MAFKKLNLSTLEVMGKNLKDTKKEYDDKLKKDKKGAEKFLKEMRANKAKLDAYNKALDNAMKDYVSNSDLYGELVIGYERDAAGEIDLAASALKEFKEKGDVTKLFTVNTLPQRLKQLQEEFNKQEKDFRDCQMPLRGGWPGSEPYEFFWPGEVAKAALSARQKTIDTGKSTLQPLLAKVEQHEKVAVALVSQADVARLAYGKGKTAEKEQVEEIKSTLSKMLDDVKTSMTQDQKGTLPNMTKTIELNLKNLAEMQKEKGPIPKSDFSVKVLSRLSAIKDNVERGKALADGVERSVKVHVDNISPSHRKDKEVLTALTQASQYVKAGKAFVDQNQKLASEAAKIATELQQRVAA